MKRIAIWAFVILLIVTIAVTFRFSGPLLFHLLLGWITFARNTLPNITLRLDGLASFGLGLLLLVVTMHMFLNWLTKNMAPVGEGQPRRWRLRWTLCGTAVVLLMFVAGIALVGITHQAVWLARTPEGMIVPRIETDPGPFASRMNLIDMTMGVDNFRDVYSHYPVNTPANGEQERPAQSWITRVMPYMWYRMSDDYDPDQAWDSPQNRADFQRVHPELLNPYLPTATGHNAAGYGVSHYAANEQLFSTEHNAQLSDAANTLLIGELNSDFSPWGEPGANLRRPVMQSTGQPGFGGPPQHDTVLFAMADGQIREIDKDIDPEVLRALGAAVKE